MWCCFYYEYMFASVCVCIHTDLYFNYFHICTKQQTVQIVHALGYEIWSFILELNLSEEKHYNNYKPWQVQFDWKSAETKPVPHFVSYKFQGREVTWCSSRDAQQHLGTIVSQWAEASVK